MRFALALLLLAFADIVLGATPQVPIAVDTCVNPPQLATGSTYSACKVGGAGPATVTDVVRTQALTGGGQSWESWATLTSSRMVCQYMVNAPCAWVSKAAVIAQCAAAACPAAMTAGSTTPTPVPPPVTTPGPSQTQTLTWTAPTANTDGSALTDLKSYNIYMNGAKVASVNAPAVSWTSPALTPGTYTYSVTAVNASGTESAQSPVVSATVVAVKLVPAAPTNVAVSATAAH